MVGAAGRGRGGEISPNNPISPQLWFWHSQQFSNPQLCRQRCGLRLITALSLHPNIWKMKSGR